MSYFKNDLHFANYCAKILADNAFWEINKQDISSPLRYIYQWSTHPASNRIIEKIGSRNLHEKVSWVIRNHANLDSDGMQKLIDAIYSLPIALDEICERCLHKGMVKNTVVDEFAKMEIEDKFWCVFLFLNDLKFEVYADESYYQNFTNEFRILCQHTLGRAGIYFMYNANSELIYIGKSINLGSRIVTSSKERKTDFIRVAVVQNIADLHIYEPYFIAINKPTLNSEFHCSDIPTFKLPDLEFSNLVQVTQPNKLNIVQ